MNIEKKEIFNFDEHITDDQLLRTYIECVVKLNTLDWFLYYEDFFIEHTNTSLLDLSTPMKAMNINEKSTNKEIIQYFRYLKACHLGIEYLEHSLKLLLLLEGNSIKQINKRGLEHNLLDHFNMIKDEEVRNIIMGSIGYLGNNYIQNVLNGKPTNMVFSEFSGESKKELELNLCIIEKASNGEELTEEENQRYKLICQECKQYEIHKHDKSVVASKKYFEAVLKLLSNSFVDLRYPEISKIDGYYNLEMILAICKSIDVVLKKEMESKQLLDSEKHNISEYVTKLITSEETKIDYDIDNEIVVLDRPLNLYEHKKMIASNISKHETLMWYMYAIEQFYLTGKTDYWATLGDLLYTTSITRERVSKKSNDKSIYENYLYYQACHLTSDYVEHSLKLILLDNGYTYKDIKEKFGHDFKKMYDSLPQDIKESLKCTTFYFDENYLENASKQCSDFRDVIKRSLKEKKSSSEIRLYLDILVKQNFNEPLTEEEIKFLNEYESNFSKDILGQRNAEYIKEQEKLSIKYFEKILTQMADAFKFTRYPDFYNFNMNYKYCLKFLLAFAQGLELNMERTLSISYDDALGNENSTISELISSLKNEDEKNNNHKR